ncbi:unnamed protein product [Lampetra fluviatilis]
MTAMKFRSHTGQLYVPAESRRRCKCEQQQQQQQQPPLNELPSEALSSIVSCRESRPSCACASNNSAAPFLGRHKEKILAKPLGAALMKTCTRMFGLAGRVKLCAGPFSPHGPPPRGFTRGGSLGSPGSLPAARLP